MQTDIDLMRELDHRQAESLDVRLLWLPHDERVVVAVADGVSGEQFTLDVHEGERALDVFHHPFAFAAARRTLQRGIDGDRAAHSDPASAGRSGLRGRLRRRPRSGIELPPGTP